MNAYKLLATELAIPSEQDKIRFTYDVDLQEQLLLQLPIFSYRPYLTTSPELAVLSGLLHENNTKQAVLKVVRNTNLLNTPEVKKLILDWYDSKPTPFQPLFTQAQLELLSSVHNKPTIR
jgi:hypothetical protein